MPQTTKPNNRPTIARTPVKPKTAQRSAPNTKTPPRQKKSVTKPTPKASAVKKTSVKARPYSAAKSIQNTSQKLKAQKRPTRQQRAAEQQRSREELNARIRTQTPANRQAVRNQKKIKGSVKNLEIKSRAKASRQQFHIKKKSNPYTGVIILGLIIFFLMFAVLFGIVAAIVAIDLHIGSGEDLAAYNIQLGEELETDYSNLFQMTESDSMRNGILYIPVSILSDMCDLTVTGVTDDLRYLVRDSDDQTIRFIVGTDLAYVNECKVRMSGSSFISDGKLYVPLDFFTEYSEGLSIDINDEDKLITVSRTVKGKDEYRRDIYNDFRFTLGKLEAADRIVVPIDMDVSEDLSTEENYNENE